MNGVGVGVGDLFTCFSMQGACVCGWGMFEGWGGGGRHVGWRGGTNLFVSAGCVCMLGGGGGGGGMWGGGGSQGTNLFVSADCVYVGGVYVGRRGKPGNQPVCQCRLCVGGCGGGGGGVCGAEGGNQGTNLFLSASCVWVGNEEGEEKGGGEWKGGERGVDFKVGGGGGGGDGICPPVSPCRVLKRDPKGMNCEMSTKLGGWLQQASTGSTLGWLKILQRDNNAFSKS